VDKSFHILLHLTKSGSDHYQLKNNSRNSFYFSTRELNLKTNILPIVVNGQTSMHTLTQSFYITKMVEAVKTLPPGMSFII